MKINDLTLFTHSLQETLHFYHGLLGFTLLEQTPQAVCFQIGFSRLRFETIENAHPQYHFAFSIPKNKVQEARQWLEQRTPLIPNPESETITHFVHWNAHAMYFYDPQGNIVEFIAREDLPATPDEHFSPESIMAINEIGLVVDAPLEWAQQYVTKAPVSFFERGPITETFTALGDDEGLLIVPQPGRHWFPTRMAAEKHPMHVILSSGDQHFSLHLEQ